MNVSTPEIRKIDEREVASVSFVGNYLGNASVFEKLFGMLCGWAGEKQLIGPETVFLSLITTTPTQPRRKS